MSGEEERFKLVVVGGGGVGKSALTIQFIQSYFVSDYDPTIEDSYTKICTVDGKETRLDSKAPSHCIHTSQDLYLAGVAPWRQAVVLWMQSSAAFDVTQSDMCISLTQNPCGSCGLSLSLCPPNSYHEVQKFHTQILRVKDRDDFPMVLVGNKADLEQQRVISREDAQAFARENRIHYMEASAKNRYNVDEAFLELVQIIRRFQEMESPPPPARHSGKQNSGGCPCVLL
ncbi:ras-related protein R-Ras [Seriola lalandi dorsalis]|uniref:ras-related protein R-Ras n=1 Tax=Seriola lalandi dorsalis TaxID=1841481 RepID=UPI000C6F7A7A|nr:ras-related protein R-Ras [Seriola lalandi dorsalis]